MRSAPLMIATATLIMASGLASAGNQPGSFAGVTIDAKIIGGDQYEPLYTRIGEWEKLTGAKVNILTKKNGFDIDKEFKSDIAANSVNWCVGWNHTSFAPQYTSLYTDLFKLVPKEEVDKYVPGIIKGATIDGKLTMLPRAQFDVSALYYLKSNYTDDAKKKAFKEKYSYDLAPPTTWQQVKDQAIFFSNPPNFYGTEFAGKEEAINGRFYEMLVAEGGEYLEFERPPRVQFGRRRARPSMVRRSLQGQGGPPGHSKLSLGRSRPRLRVRNGRARFGLAELGWLLQRPAEIESRRQRRRRCAAGRILGKAYGMVRKPRLLGHRILQEQGRGGVAGPLADQRRQPEDRSRSRGAADPNRDLAMGHRAGRQRPLQEGGADRVPGSVEIRIRSPADRRMDRDLERRLS